MANYLVKPADTNRFANTPWNTLTLNALPIIAVTWFTLTADGR